MTEEKILLLSPGLPEIPCHTIAASVPNPETIWIKPAFTIISDITPKRSAPASFAISRLTRNPEAINMIREINPFKRNFTN